MSDQELKTLLDTIETPPADLTGRVLDALRSRKRRFPKGRLLAAALAASAALVGAGRFYEYVMVGADGTVEEARVASSTAEAADGFAEKFAEPKHVRPDRTPECRSFRDFALQLHPDGGMGYGSPILRADEPPMGSYAGLWDVLSRAAAALPAPASVPEGFEYRAASAFLYLPPELLNLPQKELFDGGNGFFYQVFQFPESIRENVSGYHVQFTRGDAMIDVQVSLSGEKEKLFAPGEAKRETVNLGGRRAVYVDGAPEEGTLTIFFTGKIPAVSYIDPFDLGAAERGKGQLAPWASDADPKPQTYRYYSCDISATGVDRETLLEFARNMAVPAPGSKAPDVPAAEGEITGGGGMKVFLLS